MRFILVAALALPLILAAQAPASADHLKNATGIAHRGTEIFQAKVARTIVAGPDAVFDVTIAEIRTGTVVDACTFLGHETLSLPGDAGGQGGAVLAGGYTARSEDPACPFMLSGAHVLRTVGVATGFYKNFELEVF